MSGELGAFGTQGRRTNGRVVISNGFRKLCGPIVETAKLGSNRRLALGGAASNGCDNDEEKNYTAKYAKDDFHFFIKEASFGRPIGTGGDLI